jgi:phospholipid/cholesterol/gamma-HCH transport system permease protein
MSTEPRLIFSRPSPGKLLVRLSGSWRTGRPLPACEEIQRRMAGDRPVQSILLDGQAITEWDSGLLIFLRRVATSCQAAGIPADTQRLPAGVRRLLALATAVPERKGARREKVKEAFLSMVGGKALEFRQSTKEMLSFIGEVSVAMFRLLTGRARFRGSDLSAVIQQCGYEAVPIVSLISLLVGLILAFVGAVQLRMFGAQIYVASLVGIAMVRVMGAIMTGIIMAGRTGAAFAAELGTMQVNEEIDALKTLGISPTEFLVLPRMVALALMMPLLCLYADLMGILGGLIVGVTMLDLNIMEYYNQTRESVSLMNLWIGLFHSSVFGVLVALAGCLKGIQCGRSASAVGEATTSAVVTSIVSIILATAIITVICDVLGI